jgi:hypothetical protein
MGKNQLDGILFDVVTIVAQYTNHNYFLSPLLGKPIVICNKHFRFYSKPN